jgi:hypothetical protein
MADNNYGSPDGGAEDTPQGESHGQDLCHRCGKVGPHDKLSRCCAVSMLLGPACTPTFSGVCCWKGSPPLGPPPAAAGVMAVSELCRDSSGMRLVWDPWREGAC